MNIVTLLDMAKNCFPDRVALTNGNRHFTYEDLYNLSASAAAHIRQSEAENISLLDVASPAMPVALFGSVWAGKPFAPLNYRLSPSDLASLVEKISPAIVFCGADYHENIAPEHRTSCDELLAAQTAATEDSDAQNATTAPDFQSAAAAADQDWPSDPEDTAILLFTSGTTGGPKVAILRHRNLVSYVLGSVEFMSAGPEEAVLTSVPPYHIAAMANLLSSVYAGRRIVQLPNFDADAWIDLVAQESVTHAMVVPTMLARIADRLETRRDELPSLASVAYGGGKTSRPVVEKILELLPHTDFVNAYGLTETSSTVAVLGPDEHREAIASDKPLIRARLGSAGIPLPTMEVSIRDDHGKEVCAGTSGEIWLRGDQVSGEYKGRKSQLTPDGWFRTNDGGHFDIDGYLYIEGRLDDVIIRGGENISPGEIEDALLEHTAVADAGVVGVPDMEWGEKIAAIVVLREGEAATEDELIEYVRSQLRSQKSPDFVFFKDELPYNPTGKLLRKELRAELQEATA